MDAPTTRAWILLAIPAQGANRRDLEWRAAAINKVAPTDQEIVDSIAWLRDVGLIETSPDTFALTAAGRRVLDEEWIETSMDDTWSRVAERLRDLA